MAKSGGGNRVSVDDRGTSDPDGARGSTTMRASDVA